MKFLRGVLLLAALGGVLWGFWFHGKLPGVLTALAVLVFAFTVPEQRTKPVWVCPDCRVAWTGELTPCPRCGEWGKMIDEVVDV